MKVDKIAGGHVPQTSLNQATRKPLESPARATPIEPQVDVDVAAIERAQQALASQPNVDIDKVASIKAALQRGELSLDMGALSQAVMKFHTGHQ